MNQMKVTGTGEYGELICRYIQSGFPKAAKIKAENLLEILTAIIVGTKDLRYGPMPKPESLVIIRKTIATALQMNLPIPVLVPWGGRKMDKTLSLDVAEISGLRQILSVDEQVRAFYPPGLLVRVRIEDINAIWLYKERTGVESYSAGMQRAIDLIKGETKIIGVRESEMMDEDQYIQKAEEFSRLMAHVIGVQMALPGITATDIPEFNQMVMMGWKGTIPDEQRTYYLERYMRLYPDESQEFHIARLADYFAGSKVRYDLNGKGAPITAVGSFIQINFAHPVPGAPEGLFNNALYYRTIPERYGRTHISPWRAKGYLEMVGEDVIPKIAHPGATVADLRRSSVQLISDTDTEDKVIVRTDYKYRDDAMVHAMMHGMGI